MRHRLKKALGYLYKAESGTASVEFVLVLPAFLMIMAFSIELGVVTLRHMLLERGMDMAAREIRLSTGTAPQHSEIKQSVCDNAKFIKDCTSNLRLEMSSADLRDFNSLSTDVQCTDKAEEAAPVYKVVPGQQNQLMLLRACLKYDPLFPSSVLGKALSKDASGQARIVSMTAFVQEPL